MGDLRWSWRLPVALRALAVLGCVGLGATARGEEGAAKPEAEARPASTLEREKARGKEYLESAAEEEGAVRTKSGMVYIPIRKGTGPKPWGTNVVRVHYTGTLVDGTVFDSSMKRDRPAEFSLRDVIRCWTEGLQMTNVGGAARLVCPPELAYGDKAAGRAIPAGATLVFEVELLAIVK